MQEHIWEKEYRNPRLVTKEAEPQAAVLDFLKFLRKKQNMELSGLKVLDLGCGTGRNSNYIAHLGNAAVGIDISETALRIAKERAAELHLKDVEYIKQSIGSSLPFSDASFDVALDVTSSNSLNEKERSVYLEETARVVKPGGFFFVRALCKDGDKNAKELIKRNPGPEKDTYVMPEFGLIERVFSKEDFIETYSPFFEILELEKISHYSKFDGRIFKRNYWLCYMKKK